MNFIITTIVSILLIFLCNKKKLLLSKSGDIHQNFIGTKSTPLVGGIILFVSIIALRIEELHIFLSFVLGMLVVGVFSDTKKNYHQLLD